MGLSGVKQFRRTKKDPQYWAVSMALRKRFISIAFSRGVREKTEKKGHDAEREGQ